MPAGATLEGQINDTGGADLDERGFVWDTSSYSTPGDTAPSNTSYTSNWTETGTFSTGSYDHDVTSFQGNTTYYYRACGKNSAGWDYGDEISFTTPLIESGSLTATSLLAATEFASATEVSSLQSTAITDVVATARAFENPSPIHSVSSLSATEVGIATERPSLIDVATSLYADEYTVFITTVTSHSDTINTFAQSDRTSLELIDFDVQYDENEAAWYTDWFAEEKILGDEDELAIIAYVVPDAKEPAATVHLEYDETGNEQPDRQSDPVRVGQQQDVKTFENVPVVNDGQYRLRISNYSGYNSLTTLNVGFVH